VCLCVQYYKSLCPAVTICNTLVKTDRQTDGTPAKLDGSQLSEKLNEYAEQMNVHTAGGCCWWLLSDAGRKELLLLRLRAAVVEVVARRSVKQLTDGVFGGTYVGCVSPRDMSSSWDSKHRMQPI